jgi:diguanylate cyclase (GGDEF)-like protein
LLGESNPQHVFLPPLLAHQSRELDLRRTRAKLPHARLFLVAGIVMLLAFSFREFFYTPQDRNGTWVRAIGALLLLAEYFVFHHIGLERHFRAATTTIYSTFFVVVVASQWFANTPWQWALPGLLIVMMASAVVLLRARDSLCNIALAGIAIATMWLQQVERIVFVNSTLYLLIGTTMSLLVAYVLEKISRQAFLGELKLEYEAQNDYLTGLTNRRHLAALAQREIKRAQRFTRPLSVMLIDIDHFKNINDTYGHDAGDKMIREMGQLIAQHVRTSDVVSRHGGEEFAILLPETSPAEAMQLARRLRDIAASYRFTLGGAPVPLTISIGVASLQDEGQDWAALLKQADAAMYQAKQLGRNRVAAAAAQTITA